MTEMDNLMAIKMFIRWRATFKYSGRIGGIHQLEEIKIIAKHDVNPSKYEEIKVWLLRI